MSGHVGLKKVVLFPEIDRVKCFLSFTCRQSNVYQNMYFKLKEKNRKTVSKRN